MSEKGPTANLPAPLVPPDCDCTDLDEFMLNVERLMASELVALSSHEVIAAALFLWCRAWKQTPAASLPDDDRVIAAYARLSLTRFKKIKAEVMRGFVKCSDGRYYHRFLAKKAAAAFGRKVAFRNKRETDAKRLREWRGKRCETQPETPIETRFVAEGEGEGEVFSSDLKIGSPAENDDPFGDPEPADVTSGIDPPTGRGGIDPSAAKRDLYARGEAVIGAHSGGQVTKLLKAKGGNVALARAALEMASTAHNSREYVAAAIRGDSTSLPNGQLYDRGL